MPTGNLVHFLSTDFLAGKRILHIAGSPTIEEKPLQDAIAEVRAWNNFLKAKAQARMVNHCFESVAGRQRALARQIRTAQVMSAANQAVPKDAGSDVTTTSGSGTVTLLYNNYRSV